MAEIIDRFIALFIDHSIFFAGTKINLLKLLVFAVIMFSSSILSRFLRRVLKSALERFEADRRIHVIASVIVSILTLFIGLIFGLAIIGIDFFYIVQNVLTFAIPIGQTELNLVKIFWLSIVIVITSVTSKYFRAMLREQILSPFELPTNAEFLLLRAVHVLIFSLGILIGLNMTGLSLTSLIAVLGGLSIGIGFGLQNIASNLISGIILIFERPIRVGDQVMVAGVLGTVTAVNMRSTLIATPDNIDMIVPNSQLISETITNWTHGSRHIRIHVQVGVAYNSDTEQIKNLLLEVANKHPKVFDRATSESSDQVKPPVVRLTSFGDSALNFELLVFTYSSQRLSVASDLRFAIHNKFRENGIKIPFPQREIKVKSNGQNRASML